MTKTADIKASKYWKDKFIRWFYEGKLADKQSARIMGEVIQASINELEPHIPLYKAGDFGNDATVQAVINDYESAKEIFKTGLAHKYTA